MVRGFTGRLGSDDDPAIPRVLNVGGAASGEGKQAAETARSGAGAQEDATGEIEGEEPEAESADLAFFDQVAAELERSMPSPMGKLRLTSYWTARDMLSVTIARGRREDEKKALGDELYKRRRKRSFARLRRRPPEPGEDERHIAGWFIDQLAAVRPMSALALQVLSQPVAYVLRVTLGRPLARRKLRWLGEPPTGAILERLAPRETPRNWKGDVLGLAVSLTRQGSRRSDQELVRLVLMLGLLNDLDALYDLDAATRPSWFSPGRRCRVTPFVLSFTNVAPDNDAYRFLEALGAVYGEMKRGTTMVMASLTSEAAVPPSFDADPTPMSLRVVAAKLKPLVQAGGPPQSLPRALIVDIPTEPRDEVVQSWLDFNQEVVVEAAPGRWPRLVPFVSWTACTAAAGLVVVLLVIVVGDGGGDPSPPPPPPPPCPGIDEAAGSSELIGLSEGTDECTFFPDPENEPDEYRQGLLQDYRDVEEQIAAENSRVLADAGGDDSQYRTIVFFAPLTLPEEAERIGQSSLRQLRGVALAQVEANRQAKGDTKKIPVRVLLANAGDRFAYGPEVATQIVDRKDEDRTIVGVVGIAQSRGISRESVAELAEGNLPVVAGPITGDAMIESSQFYYQVSPLNRRVAKMLVEVATEVAVVGPSEDELTPARRAVIVMDHSDEYSYNLAQDIDAELRESGRTVERVFSYIPEELDPPESSSPAGDGLSYDTVSSQNQLAYQVCTSIDTARDVVFFTSRAQQLTGVLDDLRDDPNCDGTVTVLAGTDVTKVVQNPEVDLSRYPSLRLYYGAFASQERADDLSIPTAQRFVADYIDIGEYPETDLAVDMSDPALTYDAVLTMQEAINQAFEDGVSPTPGVVATKLADGEVEINGATGYIAISGALDTDRVPRNKPVLVLQAVPPSTDPLVLSCGQFTKTIEDTTWGPDPNNQFPCPQDE